MAEASTLVFDRAPPNEDHRNISEGTISKGKWGVLFLLLSLQVVGWIFLTLLSRGHWSEGFAYSVENDAMPTWTYVIVQMIMGVALIATFLFLKRKKVKNAARGVLVIAGILRCIAMMGEPIHESDFYRYIWDGKVANHGINPYRFEPGALFLHESGIEFEFPDKSTGVTWRGRKFEGSELDQMEKLRGLRDENPTSFNRVSHPAVTTIYPPFAQVVFSLSNSLFGDSILGLKLLFIVFDLGIVILILLILKQRKRSFAWSLLYAWNPLPIKEIANSSHYDVIAVFFVLLAIWLTVREGDIWKKVCGVAIALALGTLTKYFAGLLLPVLLFDIARSRRNASLSGNSLWLRTKQSIKAPEVWYGGLIFSAVGILGFVPYLLWDDAGFAEVFRGLSTYNQHWIYSPGLFSLVEVSAASVTKEPMTVAKLISALILLFVVLWASLCSGKNVGARCFLVMAGLFVLIPTAFPWYFCWALALVPFQNRLSWLVLGLLLPLNYLDFHSPGNIPMSQLTYHGFYATQLTAWIGFFLCWVAEFIQLLRRPTTHSQG